jgi:outer membrane lipoprotein carrier protein
VVRHILSPCLVALAAVVAVVTLAAAQAPPSADALAAAVQAKYAAVADFSASFVHTYRGGVLKKEATERGTVLILKPGRMRWTYDAPERKVFVADGRRLYSYIPEDRQVIISEIPAGDEAATPALFLTGKGNLTRDFSVTRPDVPDPMPDTYTLRFTPRKPENEFEWMALLVDRTTMQIRKLVTVDGQGGQSTFAFSNIRQNTGLRDAAFQFVVPRGVDVVTRRP